jgi:hypothetical protein
MTYKSRAGFESTLSVLKISKTERNVDRAVSVVGMYKLQTLCSVKLIYMDEDE